MTNDYHDVEVVTSKSSAEVAEIISEAKQGKLLERVFERYERRLGYEYHYEDKDRFHQEVSWAIYTLEWIEDMADMLKGLKVLEVFAGRGILGPIMSEKGIDWTCTDKHPPTTGQVPTHVQRLEALDALKQIEHDVVFASWIPYQLDPPSDLTIYKTGVPMILVGESCHGCTGSKAFWAEVQYDEVPMGQVRPGFRGLPQWDGLHDYTYVVNHEALRRLINKN